MRDEQGTVCRPNSRLLPIVPVDLSNGAYYSDAVAVESDHAVWVDKDLPLIRQQVTLNHTAWDGSFCVAADAAGLYKGRVIVETRLYIGQEKGRACLLHEKAAMDYAPKLGDHPAINYQGNLKQAEVKNCNASQYQHPVRLPGHAVWCRSASRLVRDLPGTPTRQQYERLTLHSELADLAYEAGPLIVDWDRSEYLFWLDLDPEGTYRGMIVGESTRFLAQQQQASGDVILHLKKNLGSAPSVGSRGIVTYAAASSETHVAALVIPSVEC